MFHVRFTDTIVAVNDLWCSQRTGGAVIVHLADAAPAS
jgi:hypothetical protein